MRLWKNTETLDDFYPDLRECVDLASAEVAVLGSGPIDLSEARNLVGLFRCGVGVDNVPFKECEERGIVVGLPSQMTREAIFDETASFAVHLCLNALYESQGDVATWSKKNRAAMRDRTVMVLGNGNIGGRVAKWLDGICNVVTWDLAQDDYRELVDKLPKADVVSLHFPLNDETHEWFDDRLMSLMKDGAALVNTARGGIVNEEDLFKHLSSGRLRALFDVFWQEPYRGKLSHLPEDTFRMTPHISSHSDRFLAGLADDLKRFIQSLN